jgi:hypothetical protein
MSIRNNISNSELCDVMKITFISFFLTFSLLLTAQSDTSWYRLYSMDSLESMFPSGLEPCGNDAVIVLNASGYFNDPPYHRTSLVRVDGRNGDILWQTKIAHNEVAESSDFFFLTKGLIRLKDGSFVVLFDTQTEEGKIGFVVNRIASDGSILWHRDYGIFQEDIWPIANGLGIGPDSMSFVVIAERTDLENPSDSIHIFHINEEGEILTHLKLRTGLDFYSDYCPVVMLDDSSIVVGFNLGNFDFEAHKLLRHYSYKGQTLLTKVSWDLGYWTDLKLHPSGNIVAVSQSFSGDWQNSEIHGLRTTLYSPQLDTLWSRVYNHFELPYYYREEDYPGPVSFDPDGNILVSGSGSAYNGVQPAHLVKYNLEGELQWTKRIGIGPDEALGGGVDEVGGKVVFMPQGILLVGSMLDVNDMLLIRLDSAGCVNETYCDTDFLLGLRDELQKDFLIFNLSPNPSKDFVEFSISEDYFNLLAKPRIDLVDITGRVVSSFYLYEYHQQLDLSSLPNGFYFGVLESKGSPVGFQKLVKW